VTPQSRQTHILQWRQFWLLPSQMKSPAAPAIGPAVRLMRAAPSWSDTHNYPWVAFHILLSFQNAPRTLPYPCPNSPASPHSCDSQSLWMINLPPVIKLSSHQPQTTQVIRLRCRAEESYLKISRLAEPLLAVSCSSSATFLLFLTTIRTKGFLGNLSTPL